MKNITKDQIDKLAPGAIIARQGDVAIVKCGHEPRGKKVPREAGRIVLAHGEVTGHAHAIESRYASLYLDDSNRLSGPDAMTMLSRLGGGLIPDRVLKATRTVALGHEEHGEIKLPAGGYTVRIQREYQPGELRNVAD